MIIALRGSPQGGQVTIGSLGNIEMLYSIPTATGSTLASVIQGFADISILDRSPIGGFRKEDATKLRVYGDQIYLRSTDPGILPAKSVESLRALAVKSTNEVRINWTLPNGAPQFLTVYRHLTPVAKIVGSSTFFIDHIPADQDHDSYVSYYVISHDELAQGIEIPGDYRQVVTSSPQSLLSDTYGIVTVALPTSPKGKAYETILMKNSGSDPVSWRVSAGTLPAGLTLSANGIISGTPTSSGTYTFTATVTDALAATASKPFTLVVTALPTLESVIHEHQSVVPGGTDHDH